jgi:hypothetical protein
MYNVPKKKSRWIILRIIRNVFVKEKIKEKKNETSYIFIFIYFRKIPQQ